MSKRKGKSSNGAMLDLWRPPQGAGDPIGCLSTTYTFLPGLFDEQCLARFLEIESEPNREDLAFLLERESRLGSIYAGVLVDHTQAGVEHSLRWDVLPVRFRAGKQHAKVSLLAWGNHIRIVAASANLTDPGYRFNFEVAAKVDLTPENADIDLLADTISFLRSLIKFVPGASGSLPEIRRAESFLEGVEYRGKGWKQTRRRGTPQQHLVCTLPAIEVGQSARSTIDEVVQACRRRGGSPHEAWIASPFFDVDDDSGRVTASLCKLMARAERRKIRFCVPAIRDGELDSVPRLAAPKTLILIPPKYQASVTVEMLPALDEDKNLRPWHAKMLGFSSESYSALMIGSSNFTSAGMGVGHNRNAEANLVTILDRDLSRETRRLDAVWPDMERVKTPESAEWMGSREDLEEENRAAALSLPAGFLSATYHAGDLRKIVLRLDPAHLPAKWRVLTCGQKEQELLSDRSWHECGRPSVFEHSWDPVQPPEKLLVQWDEHEAWLPLNVEDSSCLPRPEQLEHMSADDMLLILAATDPSAAFRTWAKRHRTPDLFDPDLDSATPMDLDPLKRYDLQATFLHRIRRRARILTQLRSNLQRPVMGHQALDWRLRGMVGIEPLAHCFVREYLNADGASNEALLVLADFMIVLCEVDYQPSNGSLPKKEFEKVYRTFLRELADKLGSQIDFQSGNISEDVRYFWERVLDRCRG
jgi:hypothetical protein